MYSEFRRSVAAIYESIITSGWFFSYTAALKINYKEGYINAMDGLNCKPKQIRVEVIERVGQQ
jgi:hypothetical protein